MHAGCTRAASSGPARALARHRSPEAFADGEAQLRARAQSLAQIARTGSEMQVKDRKLMCSEACIDQLTHEIAVLMRWKFNDFSGYKKRRRAR